MVICSTSVIFYLFNLAELYYSNFFVMNPCKSKINRLVFNPILKAVRSEHINGMYLRRKFALASLQFKIIFVSFLLRNKMFLEERVNFLFLFISYIYRFAYEILLLYLAFFIILRLNFVISNIKCK